MPGDTLSFADFNAFTMSVAPQPISSVWTTLYCKDHAQFKINKHSKDSL